MLGIVLWQKTLKNKDINSDEILNKMSEVLEIDTDKILDPVARERQGRKIGDDEDLIFEAEVFYKGDVNLKKDVEEMLYNFEEEYLKEKLLYNMQQLNNFNLKEDKIKSAEILKQISEINNKIQIIKNNRFKK